MFSEVGDVTLLCALRNDGYLAWAHVNLVTFYDNVVLVHFLTLYFGVSYWLRIFQFSILFGGGIFHCFF
ncbi:hypothetical protein Lalb_Chr13g0299981 [Lupinus albus]|uniref:Uncharacterized protein n=1 Tax=Lupinus albus TaxID=3870 RepID=A0A6A4PJJ7_LUPAL|nr:hypothetical protein Lalb_Chr13g0299981 [Lupinus albus]